MQIKNTTIRRLEELSCLQIAPEEYEQIRGELEEILTCFAQIAHPEGSANTVAQEAAVHDQDALRDDIPSPALPRAVLLANAPETQEGFFVVPGIMG